jgi:hypothetical protein
MIEEKIDIPIFYGTFADLTQIDLSFINGKFVRQKGKLFRQFLKSVLHKNYFDSDLLEIMKDYENEYLFEGNKAYSYALIPLDTKKALEPKNYHHFHQLILSIFPSDFSIIKTINLEYFEDGYTLRSIYADRFTPTGDGTFDNFMHVSKGEYRYVKKYLEDYFQPSAKLKYLKYILSVYSSALSEQNLIYQYLSLIICLEVIVEGNEQLTYRLKRNVALLCGQNVKSCKIIYSNIDQLYKLRSAIVHGNIDPSFKNFQEYREYLITLVARVIRELIAHNIPTINELNDKITSLGYGQNNLMSSGYKKSEYPLIDNIRLRYKAIQKY